MSTIAAMADALVTALQAAGFTEAERRPIPYQSREDCTSRKCLVTAHNHIYEGGTRQDFDEACDLLVIIQKGVTSPLSNAEVDALLDDVESLAALWGDAGALRHTLLQGAAYESGPSHPTGMIYEIEQMLERNLFTSVTLVRYKIES